MLKDMYHSTHRCKCLFQQNYEKYIVSLVIIIVKYYGERELQSGKKNYVHGFRHPTCTTLSDSWAEAHKGNWLGARTVIMAPEEFRNFSMFWPDIPINPPAWDPAIKSLIVLAATCPAVSFDASKLLLSSCYKEHHFINSSQ